jgi:hypothetical protein
MNKIIFIAIIASFIACSSSKTAISNKANTPTTQKSEKGQTVDELESLGNGYLLTGISDDSSYGYSEKKPIKLASEKGELSAATEYKYMRSLLGPKGEEISFKRLGSCCAYKTNSPRALFGSALLDKFEITISGSNEKKVIYLDMYETGIVKAPMGLTFVK